MESNQILIIVLLIGALFLFISPTLIWPNLGRTPYFIHPTAVDDPVPEEEIIAYEDLPPTAQEAFDGAKNRLYSGRDDEAIGVFQNYEFVEYQGQTHAVGLAHEDGAWAAERLIQLAMWISGTLMLGFTAYRYLESNKRVDPK